MTIKQDALADISSVLVLGRWNNSYYLFAFERLVKPTPLHSVLQPLMDCFKKLKRNRLASSKGNSAFLARDKSFLRSLPLLCLPSPLARV